MTWQRFEYICRRAYTHISQGETVVDSLSKARGEKAADLYGDQYSTQSLQQKILSNIEGLDRDEAINTLSIYKNLRMDKQLDNTLRFKRVFAYLCYVSLFFYIVTAIYHVKTIPTFEHFFTDLGWGVPQFFKLYADYGVLILIFLLAFLLLSLVVSFKLTRLMQFRKDEDQGFIFRLFLFPSIKSHYHRIKEILGFPVDLKNTGSIDNTIFAHLSFIKSSNMDLAYEMKVLLEVEVSNLQSECRRQIKIMTIILFSVMVASIFSFLFAAYTPLFYMGEGI